MIKPALRFFLFICFSLLVQASAPKGSGKENPDEVSERNEQAILDALRPILTSMGAGARIDYHAVCRASNKEKAVWFPRVKVQRSSTLGAGVGAVRQLFASDDRVVITNGANGLVRIKIGAVSSALLQTKISNLKLNALQQYNPYDALGAIETTSEFQSVVKKLHLYDVSVVIGGLVIEPEPGLAHLPSVMRSVTIDQVLDAIAKTFGGIVVFGECASPVDNTPWVVLTFEFARKLGTPTGQWKDMQRVHPKPFVEGNIRIVSPVRQTKSKEGLIEMHYNDGGTMMIRIVDADGKRFDVYVDHRLDHERQWGAIYLNGYPDTKKSIRLSKQREFKDSIMKQLWIGNTDGDAR